MSNNQFLQLSTGYNGYAELREDSTTKSIRQNS